MIGHKAILFVPIKPSRRSSDDEDQEEWWLKLECRGICEKFQTKRRYDYGKKCVFCDVFLRIVENSCPCCGKYLRTKSIRYKKYNNFGDASKISVEFWS